MKSRNIVKKYENLIKQENPLSKTDFLATNYLSDFEKYFSAFNNDIQNKYIDYLFETIYKCLESSQAPKVIALFNSLVFIYSNNQSTKINLKKYLDLLFALTNKLSDSELINILQINMFLHSNRKIVYPPEDSKHHKVSTAIADVVLKLRKFRSFELLANIGVKTSFTKQDLILESLHCPTIHTFRALQKSSPEYTGEKTFLVEETLRYMFNQYLLQEDSDEAFKYGLLSHNLNQGIVPDFLNTEKDIEKIIGLTNNIIYTYIKIKSNNKTFDKAYYSDAKTSLNLAIANRNCLSKLKEDVATLLKELKNIDEKAAATYLKIFNHEEILAKSSQMVDEEIEKIANDSNLTTNVILNNDYTLLANLYQEFKIDITRGLTLGGALAIQRLLEQAQISQKDKKDGNDIALFETLQYYQKHTSHLNHQVCNIFIDILNEKFDKSTLDKIVKTNPNIKDIFLGFIKTLSPASQAYIFKQSVEKGTNLFIIWETARKEGQSPKVTKGALKEVKDNFEKYLDKTTHTKEKVLKEILNYQKQFQVNAIVNSNPDLKEENTKAIDRTLTPLEFAFNQINHELINLNTLYQGLGKTFVSIRENKAEEENILGYAFALAQPKTIMKLIEKNQGADTILLNSFLNIQLKKMEESFQKLMTDILDNKLSLTLIEKLTQNNHIFIDKTFHYLNSLPPEKEYSILHTAFTKKTAFSYIFAGNRIYGSMGKAYQRMKALEQIINNESEKKRELTLLEDAKMSDEYKNIFNIFFQLQGKYQKELDQSDFREYHRLKIRFDVCTLCLKSIINGEKLNKNIMQTVESAYPHLKIFKEGNVWSVFSYKLSDAINGLLRVQGKIEQATMCEATPFTTSGEPELSLDTHIPVPSAPPAERVPNALKTYESSHSTITSFMTSQQTFVSNFSFIQGESTIPEQKVNLSGESSLQECLDQSEELQVEGAMDQPEGVSYRSEGMNPALNQPSTTQLTSIALEEQPGLGRVSIMSILAMPSPPSTTPNNKTSKERVSVLIR